MGTAKSKSAWLALAIASGACAAFNGVFAKLYAHSYLHIIRTHMLIHLAQHYHGAHFVMGARDVPHLQPRSLEQTCRIRHPRCKSTPNLLPRHASRYTARAHNHPQFFFALNLVFNTIMWGLFTRALTLASSTVRVSVINTSANFVITAVLGAAIFSEALPGLWWLGAAMLIAGSVIIGGREGRKGADAVEREPLGQTGEEEPRYLKSWQRFRDDPAELGGAGDMDAYSNRELRSADETLETK